MRVLMLYAHPVPGSYAAALRDAALEGLAAAGHEADLLDLYAEGFDPVLSRAEREGYHAVPENRASVAPWIARFEAADALVIVSPVWNFGMPAILKGFLDRVFLPGVTFVLEDGRLIRTRPMQKLAVIHTYGATRLQALWAGDPPRKIAWRILGSLLADRGARVFLALYGMNRATDARRAAFLGRVRETMGRF